MSIEMMYKMFTHVFRVLIVCLLFVGGAILIVPVAMIGIAAGIMKSCIKT